MNTKFKILILKFDPNDIGQLQQELEKSGLGYRAEVVQTRKDYEKALASSPPDIILADYSLPSFDGLSALRIRQQLAPETPLIIVSGTIGEENAVELIRMGVTDYVLKEKMYQIGPKIHRALKEARARQEKEMAEGQLRQREQQLRKIMDLSLDVICTVDEEGRFVTVGAASTPNWGYLPQELIGKRVVELVHPQDQEKTLKAIADLKNGMDLFNFENRYLHKDGKVVTLLWSAHWDPEEKLGYSVARNVTKIKKAEEKIKNNEKRFRTLLQNSKDGLTLLAADGRIIKRSPSALKLLEFDAHDLPERFRLDLVHPDDLPAVTKAYRQVMKHDNESITIECRILLADGTYKWLEATFTNQLQEPAVAAIVLNYRDITESKRAEIALKNSEARLKQAQAIGHMGNWEMNWADGSTVWSDEMYRIFGVDKKDVKPSFEAFVSFIHPEDRPAVLIKIEQANASLENGALSFRMVRPDGQVRYLVSERRFELNGKGELVNLFGVLKDVTERRLTEIALEKSEEKYRNLFRLSPTPMWLYDVETFCFLDVNEAAVKHYGYSKEEFLDMTVHGIRRQEDVERLEAMANFLKGTRGHYSYIAKLVKKSGEVIDVDIKNSFIDIGGRETRLVIATDISERMKYIQAIQEQNAMLREIAWIQSHVVRAPLARMMGLINLLDYDMPEKNDQVDLLSLIADAAHQLDGIIRDIVRKTEQVNNQQIVEEQLIS
jgi:PAS domain S-box-containing protein